MQKERENKRQTDKLIEEHRDTYRVRTDGNLSNINTGRRGGGEDGGEKRENKARGL